MTMITPSYLGETIEYSSLHACRSTLEDPTIEARALEGDDPAETIVDFARRNQITQILLSQRNYSLWSRLLGTDLILRVVRKAQDIRVIVVAERQSSA